MKRRNLKLETRITLGLAAPILLLIGLAAAAWSALRDVRSTNERVGHTQFVIHKANGLLAESINMETGLRGFLLAGEEPFLEPFEQGREHAERDRVQLLEAVADDPTQLERLREIGRTIAAWIDDVATPSIALRRRVDGTDATDELATAVRNTDRERHLTELRQALQPFVTNAHSDARRLAERADELLQQSQQARTDAERDRLAAAEPVAFVEQVRRIHDDRQAIDAGLREALAVSDLEIQATLATDLQALLQDVHQLRAEQTSHARRCASLDALAAGLETWLFVATAPAAPAFESRPAARTTAGAPAALDAGHASRAAIAELLLAESIGIRQLLDTAAAAEQRALTAAQARDDTLAAAADQLELAGRGRELLATVVEIETAARGFLLTGDGAAIDRFETACAAFEQRCQALRAAVREHPGQVAHLDGASRAMHAWRQRTLAPLLELRRTIDARQTMEDVAALVGEARGKTYFDGLRDRIAAFTAHEEKRMTQRQAEARATADAAGSTLLFGCATAVLLAVGLGWMTTRSITRPIGAVVDGLARLSEGDLTGRLELDSSDEIGAMARAFNRTAQTSSDTMRRLLEAANELEQGTHDVTASSQQLAEGSGRQAGEIEEIDFALQEVATATRENATTSDAAAALADASRTAAREGSTQMQELADAMQAIQASSADIAKVLTAIDGIAFQTNLLALNAAVEAARAGEAGRSFAVVADEVRQLAHRSAEAARNSAAMIEAAESRSNHGVRLAAQVRDSLARIDSSTDETSSMMARIASAGERQADGVANVARRIEALNAVAQQSAGSAQTLAASARTTSSQLQSIREIVGRFRT